MHHHTRWFIYILLLTFVLLMGYLFKVKLEAPNPYVVAPVLVPARNTYFKEIKTKVVESYVSYDIVYPQFTYTDALFNKKIADTVRVAQDEFSKNAEDNWKAYRETSFENGDPGEFPADPYPFYVKWEQTQVNDKYISILMRIGGYNGGAHGYENIISFNYDVVAQRELSLADMFMGDNEYLNTVSGYSRVALLKTLSEKVPVDEMTTPAEKDAYIVGSIIPMLYAGTEPTIENFSVFTFTDTEVALYFSQYQVAAYVYGEQKVVMPRK